MNNLAKSATDHEGREEGQQPLAVICVMEIQTTPTSTNTEFVWYPFSVSYLGSLSVEERKKHVSTLAKNWNEYKNEFYKQHNDTKISEWKLLLQFYQQFQQYLTKTSQTTKTTNESIQEIEEEPVKQLERNDTIILQWNTPPEPSKTKTLSLSTDSSVPEEFYVQPNEPHENNANKTQPQKPIFFVPDSQGVDGEEQVAPPAIELPDIPEIPNSVTEISTQTEDQEVVVDEEEAPKETADKIELDNAPLNRQPTKPLNLEEMEEPPQNDQQSTPQQQKENGTSKSSEKDNKPHRRVSSVIRAVENDSTIKSKLPSPLPQTTKKRGRPSKAEIAKRKEEQRMQKMLQKEAQKNTKMDEPTNTNEKHKPASPEKNSSPPPKNGKEHEKEKEDDMEEEEEVRQSKSPHKTRQDLLGEIENLFKGGLLSPKKARVT